MAYGLKSCTYNYETILNAIAENSPAGAILAEIRKESGFHKSYDISAVVKNKGRKQPESKGLNPHFTTEKINPTVAVYRISKEGKAHLKEFAHLVQNGIPNIELQWKDGFDETMGVKATSKNKIKNTQQELIPIEENITLSDKAQAATELFQDVIVENHEAKTCVEEIHVAIAKYFETNPESRFKGLLDGLLTDVLKETDQFRVVMNKTFKLTTKILQSEALAET